MSKLLKTLKKLMMDVISKMTPSCQVVSERVSRSMDGKLTWKEKIGAKIHLLGCELCERYRKQLMIIKDMLENCPEKLVDIDINSDIKLSAEKKKKILKVLHEES